jgi:hypothetical protein
VIAQIDAQPRQVRDLLEQGPQLGAGAGSLSVVPPSALRSALGIDIAAHVERTYKLAVIYVVAPDAQWPQPPPGH